MLFGDDFEDIKSPTSSKIDFATSDDFAKLHNSFSQSKLHHVFLLPCIYLEFPELLNDLISRIESLDLIERFDLKPNENGNILMEDLSICIEFAQKTSFYNKKIIVIYGASSLSHNVANALLKILEEPPSDTLFFLIYNKKGKVIETIRSRSLLIEVKNSIENFRFICNNFIKEGFTINELLQITGGKINILPLFKSASSKKITDEFEALIGDFSYINFKKFFSLHHKDEVFESLICLLIENKIRDKASFKILTHFTSLTKYLQTYNINSELFFYSSIKKVAVR